MSTVQMDEFGPWINLGHGGIRPAGPTALKAGDSIDTKHFGGSTLYGVGKVAGKRGSYKEAWLSAPQSKEVHGDNIYKQVGFDFSMECHQADLAVFRRANPSYSFLDPIQPMLKLKNGRAKYRADKNYDFGLQERKELIAEGIDIMGAIRAHSEALELKGHAALGAKAPASRSKAPRV